MKKILVIVCVAIVVVIAGFLLFDWLSTGVEREERARAASSRLAATTPRSGSAEPATEAPDAISGTDVADAEEPEPAPTAEEKAAAEEEKLVNTFDGLTDKWMEPAKDGVQMADIADFVRTFKAVPKARQDECLHRALNLVPDENVMLLAGILLDKSVDKDLIELVYRDVLNRDEDVKKPILQEIFKDKEHPCWADTAWILDVTGELPDKE